MKNKTKYESSYSTFTATKKAGNLPKIFPMSVCLKKCTFRTTLLGEMSKTVYLLSSRKITTFL